MLDSNRRDLEKRVCGRVDVCRRRPIWGTEFERRSCAHCHHGARQWNTSMEDKLYPKQHRSTSPTQLFRVEGMTWGRALAGGTQRVALTDGNCSYQSHIWIPKYTRGNCTTKRKQRNVKQRFAATPNTTTRGWQWCHRNIRNSMGRCPVHHCAEASTLTCNIVNHEQSDKKVRSCPSRFPRGKSGQYHSRANLLEKKHFQHRIPHVVLEVVVKTRFDRCGWRMSSWLRSGVWSYKSIFFISIVHMLKRLSYLSVIVCDTGVIWVSQMICIPESREVHCFITFLRWRYDLISKKKKLFILFQTGSFSNLTHSLWIGLFLQ